MLCVGARSRRTAVTRQRERQLDNIRDDGDVVVGLLKELPTLGGAIVEVSLWTKSGDFVIDTKLRCAVC